MTTDVRSSVPAFTLSRGIGFAVSALLIELVLPLVTNRLEDAAVTEPLDPVPYVAGALLRVAAEALIFAAIAWTIAESRSRATRVFAVLVSCGMLYGEAGSYLWLGEHGALLSFRSALFPMLAYTGTRAMIGLAAALAGTGLALGVAHLLEKRFVARYEHPNALGVDLLLLAVAVLFGGATAWLGGGSLRIGATHPFLAWFLDVGLPAVVVETPEERPEFDPSGVRLPPDDVLSVVRLGQQPRHAHELDDLAFPYCRASEPIERTGAARSVVLLVLRGVSSSAIAGDTPPLPTLARLARDGASFTHAISGSDDPTQGLVQILSGISPLAPSRYHEMAELPRLPSLPATLAERGLATAFVSSFDLSPGRERTYLRDLRFESIDEPTFSTEAMRGATSGSDAATITDLIARLDATRARGARFVVAPLSSAIPDEPETTTASPDPVVDAGAPDAGAASLAPPRDRLSDVEAQLARFVAWFEAHEASRGTVLVVVGDSAPPVSSDSTLSSLRFDVPLVFSNLRTDERNRGRARANALVGLLDVADTVLGLEGIGPTGCFQGRDLFAAREPIPQRRRLIAFGGPDQSHVYVFDGRFRWQIDRATLDGPFQVFDVATDHGLAHDLYDADDSAVPFVRDQILAMLGLGRYLASNDRFVPGSRAPEAGSAIADGATRELALLSGTTTAGLGTSLAARKAAGFQSFLLPVAIDGATLDPVVAGKPLVDVLRALARNLGPLELALDVAMPEPAVPRRSIEAARRLSLALDAAALPGSVLVLPRDPIMATSLAARSSRQVLVRLPGNARSLVELADGFGTAGIVVTADNAEASFIALAHTHGLRVVIDGVGSRDAWASIADAHPDYAIVTTPSPLAER